MMLEEEPFVTQQLQSALQGTVCSEHGAPVQLHVSQARINHDGSINRDVARQCHVYMVTCQHTAAQAADGAAALAAPPRCCRWMYDGHADELFNLNNSELFAERYLYSVLVRMQRQGASLSAERVVQRDCEMALPPQKRDLPLVSLPLFNDAFFGYLGLLKDALPPHRCPICGEQPLALLCG